jgi:hypothetical protein
MVKEIMKIYILWNNNFNWDFLYGKDCKILRLWLKNGRLRYWKTWKWNLWCNKLINILELFLNVREIYHKILLFLNWKAWFYNIKSLSQHSIRSNLHFYKNSIFNKLMASLRQILMLKMMTWLFKNYLIYK